MRSLPRHDPHCRCDARALMRTSQSVIWLAVAFAIGCSGTISRGTHADAATYAADDETDAPSDGPPIADLCPDPPSGMQPDGCDAMAIHDGQSCVPISYVCGTAIVGQATPITSRAQLDEIEKSFTKRSYPTIDPALFSPTS